MTLGSSTIRESGIEPKELEAGSRIGFSDSGSGPVFVVGVWRSGTSLLQALLNQHSQIGLAYEAELPLLSALFPHGRAKRDWMERWDFWNGALERHRVTPKLESSSCDLRTATETAYRAYATRKGARIWGEKSPNYWDRLDRIAEVFPDARFIIIWRDPVGVCRSVIKAGEKESYFAKPGMGLRALFACKELKTQRDLLIKRGIPVHEIQYERLIQSPASILRDVCVFLNVPFEPQMSSLKNANRDSFYEGEHHAAVKGDQIVASHERPEILQPRSRSKIESYIALWRKETDGQWPLYPLKPLKNEANLPFPTRLADAAQFWMFRKLDSFVAFFYCWAPFWLLSARRAWKRRSGQMVRTAGSTSK